MSAFEFLFSFYGLLLGLSFADLAAGFSRAWDRRAIVRTGVMGPLLAVVLILDLVSFWTNTWEMRDQLQVGYYVALGAALVALLYYFAATQVFPREGAETAMDDHVLAHRKTVVVAVILSNLLATFGYCLVMGFSWPLLGYNLLLNLPYILLLASIGWLPGRRAVIGALIVTAAVSLFYQPIMFGLAALFR